MFKPDEPRHSFEIKNSNDFFNKLLQEYSDFDKQHLNPRHAINCAITSWHLTDWTYHEFYSRHVDFQDSEKIDKKGCVKKISGLLKYQQYITKKCPELEFMRLIANGSKHCLINDKSRTEKTSIKGGGFSTAFSRHALNVPRFEIQKNNSEKIDFEKTLISTIQFWQLLIEEQENKTKED